jgi:uncharacterized protein
MRILSRPSGKLLIVPAVMVVAFLGLWALWWEPSSLTVVRRSVTVRPWHREHEGLKIAVISDLLVGSLYWDLDHFEEVVAAINAEHPDLLMILGDLVQGSPRGDSVQPESIADRLAQVVAPLGRIAVLGNHDVWRGAWRVRRALESRGLRVLEDENVQITHRGKSFWVSGLADWWTQGNQLEATLARIENDDPVIVIMHEPLLFEQMPARVSLTLAGHTHGGQVNLPIVGRLFPLGPEHRYAYGLIDEGGKKLLVTSGIGTSILPVRFRVPPEIVILTVSADRRSGN